MFVTPVRFRLTRQLLSVLTMLMALVCAGAPIRFTGTTSDLGCEVSERQNGARIVTNNTQNASRFTLDTLEWRQPVIFELGARGRHWRRAYPCRGDMGFLERPNDTCWIAWARPATAYEMWKVDVFANYVLRSVCQVDPSGMMQPQKLKVLATTLFSLRASKVTDESAYKIRLVSEAYQALIGLRFDCSMDYAASGTADYRVFAGRPFGIECRVLNDKFADIGPCTVRIIAPDEWKVGGEVTAFTPVPCQTTRCRFAITPSGKSMLRPKQYPVIAELTFRHQGRKIIAHYPTTVEVSSPFTASLNIISADRDRINAEVTTKSLFTGIAMKNVSVYPFIPDNIKVEPASQSFSFRDSGRFRVTYAKTGGPSPVLRAVTLRTKADEHTVDLRTVMEAYLPIGRRTYGEALWMNDAEDGKTVSMTVGDRRCRQMVASQTDGSRHMYFTLSPNLPTSGNTYIAVTYFDGPQGSFRIQYDSQSGAYKDSPETVQLRGTNTWKEAIFVLPDVRFANRQNAESDFRLTATGGDPPIADVAVSKFPLGDRRRP